MATRQRRPWGTARDKPALNVKIDAEAKARLSAIADALGITMSEALERTLLATSVDAHGRPAWYDGPLPTDNELELPMQRTA